MVRKQPTAHGKIKSKIGHAGDGEEDSIGEKVGRKQKEDKYEESSRLSTK